MRRNWSGFRTVFTLGKTLFSQKWILVGVLILLSVAGGPVACTSTTKEPSVSKIALLSYRRANVYHYALVDGAEIVKDPDHPKIIWSGTNISEACIVLRNAGIGRLTWLEYSERGFPLPNSEIMKTTLGSLRRCGVRVRVLYVATMTAGAGQAQIQN